jgi:hypothetical protein
MSNGHSAGKRCHCTCIRKASTCYGELRGPARLLNRLLSRGGGLHQVVIETSLEGSAPILFPSIAGQRDEGRRGGLQETVANSPGRAGARPVSYSSGGPCLDQSRDESANMLADWRWRHATSR